MADERLAALRQALDDAVLTRTGRSIGDLASGKVLADIMPEIEALRSDKEVAMREIVQAVASSNPYGSWYPATNSPAGVVCRWCMERALSPAQCQHDHECTWRQARTLLGTYDGEHHGDK